MKIPSICFGAFMALASAGIWAQTAEEDSLFGDGGDPVVTQASSDPAAQKDLAGTFLGKDQVVTWGGEFGYSFSGNWKNQDPEVGQMLKLTLHLTARPEKDLRVGTKGTISYDPAAHTSSGTIQEAFADFQPADKVYLRLGKQFFQWGRGYFYSPADVLNLTQIDVTDPTAIREGPVALKSTFEAGDAGSWQGVLATDGVAKGSALAYALQGTFLTLLGESSWGAYYQPSGTKKPRVFNTNNMKVGSVDVFTELVVSYGSDGTLVRLNQGSPEVYNNDGTLVPQVTVGANYSKSDLEKNWNVSLLVQYEYNGAGADNPADYATPGVRTLVGLGRLKAADLTGYDKHYVAGTASLSDILKSKITATISTLDAVGEGSYQVKPQLSWSPTDALSLRTSVTVARGPSNTEYSPAGDLETVGFGATLWKHFKVDAAIPLTTDSAVAVPTLTVTLTGFEF